MFLFQLVSVTFRKVRCTCSSSTAVGLLVMMYPILCKVKYETLHHVFRERAIWVQIGFSVIINWLVAPLLMVGTLSDLQLETDQIARSGMGIPSR